MKQIASDKDFEFVQTVITSSGSSSSENTRKENKML